jgi:exopolyphosphatase/guanosine-5'-triphosphate,3'-diphosphate pyrophosphatase
MWLRHHGGVLVAVVDVGSNTVRLHVARGGEAVHGARELLGLGESVERFGSIPEAKLSEVSACVTEYIAEAHRLGAERIEVLVTSPGRQAANSVELLERLRVAAQVPVRVLSAMDEARLSFLGATAATQTPSRKLVAVCDVGGGSAQISVGTPRGGPAWAHSLDIGSTRLTSRCLQDDPPGIAALEAARAEVDRYLDGVVPPLPKIALAVGGSARALRKVVGSPLLGRAEMSAAADLVASVASPEIAARFDIAPARARTLPAGVLILAAVTERLGVPLRVVPGGIREGAVIELEAASRAAA